jgi:hypothetical protein
VKKVAAGGGGSINIGSPTGLLPKEMVVLPDGGVSAIPLLPSIGKLMLKCGTLQLPIAMARGRWGERGSSCASCTDITLSEHAEFPTSTFEACKHGNGPQTLSHFTDITSASQACSPTQLGNLLEMSGFNP